MSDEKRAGSGGLGPVARRLAASQRVMIVEDEPDIALFLRAYFRASGYDLVHVDPDNVDDVLVALEDQKPTLLLLDLRLRGFRGEEIYTAVRADTRWAFMPILVVSAETFQGSERPTGIDGHVTKPFNTDALAALVKEHIDKAAELAKVGVDDDLGVMSEDYLRTRLIDEVNAGHEYKTTFSFGLVKVRSLDEVIATLGEDGARDFFASLLGRVRDLFPDGAVLGVTTDNELAVIIPGLPAERGAELIGDMVTELSGMHEMAGGAVFEVDLIAGVAGYPENAADADELYMAADGALTDAASGDQRHVRAI